MSNATVKSRIVIPDIGREEQESSEDAGGLAYITENPAVSTDGWDDVRRPARRRPERSKKGDYMTTTRPPPARHVVVEERRA